jgi:hypothetical protein
VDPGLVRLSRICIRFAAVEFHYRHPLTLRKPLLPFPEIIPYELPHLAGGTGRRIKTVVPVVGVCTRSGILKQPPGSGVTV